jgi:lysophospholipase L1-like esterase
MRLLSNITFLVAALMFVGCGGTPIQPTPSESALQISCPSSAVREATTPQGTSVQWDEPRVSGGRPPYSVQCNPGSGSVFAVGDSVVQCSATDADMKQAACTFAITVRVSRMLAKTHFLAFGDSITAGQVPIAGLMMVDLLDSYPYKLEQMLRGRYPAQDIMVDNSGYGGETPPEGVIRLPGVLDARHPEVLLLQEGTNGLTTARVTAYAASLRSMVLMTRARGIDVILANVLPVGPPHTNSRPTKREAVLQLNQRIEAIAAELGIGAPLDLYAAFVANPQLIGSDGLHPTRDGYTRIAELFAVEVVRRYGRGAGVSSTSQSLLMLEGARTDASPTPLHAADDLPRSVFR